MTNENPKEKELTTMEKIISLCKRRGFIFQGSEIYGGLAGTWDYGPLGVALKKNIENLWWKRFVTDREDMYGVDAAILMNPKVWKSSGHVDTFTDPLVECLECKRSFRVDHLEYDEKLLTAYKNATQKAAAKLLNTDYTVHQKAFDDAVESCDSILEYVKALGRKKLTEEELSAFREFVMIAKDSNEKGKSVVDQAERLVSILSESKKFLGILMRYFLNNEVDCPNCGKKNWGIPRKFNMMLKTQIGPVADDDSISYLRPETAGGMFVNFKNILDTFHPKLPFGMAQIGKAFRNEIAPRDFIFRVRELEQMEIEYFVNPIEWEGVFESFRKDMWSFITDDLGLRKENVHELEVADEDRAHYSKRTIDFEFDFPFGKKELYGLAYRTDFDLKSHAEGSSVDLSYFDEETKQRFVPHVIEPSFGVGRSILAVLSNAYAEDDLGGETRAFLKLSPKVAPFLVAVSPLLKNKPQLVEVAQTIYRDLKKKLGRAIFDDNGNVGKRYRRQDEIGTPFCVVVDFDTIGAPDANPEFKDMVTVRHRDTGEQERVKIADLANYLEAKLK